MSMTMKWRATSECSQILLSTPFSGYEYSGSEGSKRMWMKWRGGGSIYPALPTSIFASY